MNYFSIKNGFFFLPLESHPNSGEIDKSILRNLSFVQEKGSKQTITASLKHLFLSSMLTFGGGENNNKVICGLFGLTPDWQISQSGP